MKKLLIAVVCAGMMTGCDVKNPFEATPENHVVSMVQMKRFDQVYPPVFRTNNGGSLFIHHWWSGSVWCYTSKEQMGYVFDLFDIADKVVYDGHEYIKFDKRDNLYSPLRIKDVIVGQCFNAKPEMMELDSLVISGKVDNKDALNNGKEYHFTVSKEAAKQFNELAVKQALKDAKAKKDE